MKNYWPLIWCTLMLVCPANADTTPSIISPPAHTEEKSVSRRYYPVSMTGQSGSINVPSAFIEKGVANAAIYNVYSYQNNIFGPDNRLKNDTVYGAFSYAPLQYLEVSISSLDSLSNVNNSQSIRYSGDLHIGIKAGYPIGSHLSVAGLGEILTYSKVASSGYAGYNGDATGYTLSLLISYSIPPSLLSFPMITNLRIGYMWDNTEKLISQNQNNFIPPIGKYAMGIRGDDLTLLALSFLFPIPQYYIEPMLEFTSRFANKYSSYSITDPFYNNVSYNENPLYLTPGIIFYTPVEGLRVAVASELSLSKKLNQSSGPVFITPQAIWVLGLTYSL